MSRNKKRGEQSPPLRDTVLGGAPSRLQPGPQSTWAALSACHVHASPASRVRTGLRTVRVWIAATNKRMRASRLSQPFLKLNTCSDPCPAAACTAAARALLSKLYRATEAAALSRMGTRECHGNTPLEPW